MLNDRIVQTRRAVSLITWVCDARHSECGKAWLGSYASAVAVGAIHRRQITNIGWMFELLGR